MPIGVTQSLLTVRHRWVAVVGLTFVFGCQSSEAGVTRTTAISSSVEPTSGSPTSAVVLPPANGDLDYQLGGAYEPPAGVDVVTRDRTEAPAPDLYNVCYVNGFQTQPDESQFWLDENPDLLLRDDSGQPRVDPEFPDEFILDTSTQERREQLVDIVGDWISGCADDGFQAVEIDNLDTYARFDDALDEDSAVAYARALTDSAHARGMPIAQKNSAELLGRRSETGFDFAIVEQCNEFDECDDFVEAYGDQIYVIEYDHAAFTAGCNDFPNVSIVFRDVELAPPTEGSYRRESC